jgi:hypothetical protein
LGSYNAGPSPSQTYEIDYYEYANDEALNTKSWRTNVSQQFALYGISINISDTNTFNNEDIKDHNNKSWFDQDVDPSNGFKAIETRIMTDYLDSESDGDNIIVVNDSQESLSNYDNGDFEGYHPGEHPAHFTDWVGIYNAGRASLDTACSATSREASKLNAQTVLAEEIGHDWHIGELDDKSFSSDSEVYSGGNNDPTPEQVSISRCTSKKYSDATKWSVMGDISGATSKIWGEPMNGQYAPFSIEELLTIRG